MNAVNLLNPLGLPLGFILPRDASTYSKSVDNLFNGITAITVVFCLLIFVLLAVFAIKYRYRKDRPATASESHAAGHSTTLELTWTIIPTLITLVIFFYGFRGYL